MPDAADQLVEHVWAYVRGDVSDRDFRSLVKATENAESALGTDLYMAIWAPDLDAHDSVEGLKDALLTFLRARSGSGCRCRELADLAKVHWSGPPESGGSNGRHEHPAGGQESRAPYR